MALTTTRNLVINGNCESGSVASDYNTSVAPAGWTLDSGSTLTGVAYSIGGENDLNSDDSAALAGGGGNGYFAGGPGGASASAYQFIDLHGYRSQIAAGGIKVDLAGDFGGYADQSDSMALTVIFLKADQTTEIGRVNIGDVTEADRAGETELLHREGSFNVPKGTYFLKVELDATRTDGNYNDGYADNISVGLSGNDLPGGYIIVKATHDFSGETLSNAGGVEFTGAKAATATFAAEQFGGNGIGTLPVIFGSAKADTLQIVVGASHAFDGTALLFQDWTDGKDHVHIVGSEAGDTITDTSRNDTIDSGGGQDTIYLASGGSDVVNAGTEDDSISFGANFTAATRIDGGAGTDTVFLTGDYSLGVTLAAATIKNIEIIHFATSFNYNLTINDGNVAAGQTLRIDGSVLSSSNTLVFNGTKEHDGNLDIRGGHGADILEGGSHSNTFFGSEGADIERAGAGVDTFAYQGAGDSTGAAHDTVIGFNALADKFDIQFLNSSFNTVDTPVAGQLRSLHFDHDLTAALANGKLAANDAVLFTASSGDLSGHIFLVVDVNHHKGYQAGSDLVVELSGATHLASFGDGDFIS